MAVQILFNINREIFSTYAMIIRPCMEGWAYMAAVAMYFVGSSCCCFGADVEAPGFSAFELPAARSARARASSA